ncbi:MAG: hypothetical protein II629_02745 [Ruminococcus sp.]|jgi:hypothetical protein|nr:hypothetical protein [Ruminococcus sp.]MBQ1687576.1 hypothetical protein [Ruminococcus sp.]MBQ2358034.1 hypothetical protein [Ruminococcus sp.]MBQ3987659.1 hypothetical protein [Ruminococcus sp.]
MKCKVKTIRGKHPRVEVVFEKEKYALAGELLLAERPFLGEIIKTLGSVGSGQEAAGNFSGNAFSVWVTPESTKIANDINGEEIEVPTKDLLKLAKAYQKQYDRIHR